MIKNNEIDSVVRRESRDTSSGDDYYFFDKKGNHIGTGFIPNKGRREGKICLTRCPICRKQNYAMNVISGICKWCNFDANHWREENLLKYKNYDE